MPCACLPDYCKLVYHYQMVDKRSGVDGGIADGRLNYFFALILD